MSISIRRDRCGTFADAMLVGPVLAVAFLAVVAQTPLLIGITSWLYPASIAVVLIFLALVSTEYGRVMASGDISRDEAPDIGTQTYEVGPTSRQGRWVQTPCRP